MGDGSLSQDEIDALLQGAEDIGVGSDPMGGMDMAPPAGSLSMADHTNFQGVLVSAISAVAPSLSGYLGGKNIVLSNPVIESRDSGALKSGFAGKFVQVTMDYGGALTGKNVVIFNYGDAGSISSLMMGDAGGAAPAELTEAHKSTIQEFSNQFISSMSTQFSSKLGGTINTTPAIVSVANSPAELQIPGGEMVKVTYDMVIDGVLNSKLYHIVDLGIAASFSGGGGAAAPQQQFQPQAPQTQISSVRFPQIGEGMAAGGFGDISLLLDVEMTMTVELGRTSKLVKDILGLGEGSIIELDKLAGEPVDLLVNGKLIAKGEVVVIDENFGVRVTDIVSQDERFKTVNA